MHVFWKTLWKLIKPYPQRMRMTRQRLEVLHGVGSATIMMGAVMGLLWVLTCVVEPRLQVLLTGVAPSLVILIQVGVWWYIAIIVLRVTVLLNRAFDRWMVEKANHYLE